MHPYAHLSRAERIRRIGEILAKGVTLLAIKQQQKDHAAAVAEVAAEVEQSESDWITRGIVEFLKRVGWASPRDIYRHLDVPPRTGARRLHALLASGILERRGLTSAAQYGLRAAPLQDPAPRGTPVTPA
jgi:DNA-binding Lrp family transcriptional regulator